jgi:hypothetical protein
MLCLELDRVSRDYQYLQLTSVHNIVWIPVEDEQSRINVSDQTSELD